MQQGVVQLQKMIKMLLPKQENEQFMDSAAVVKVKKVKTLEELNRMFRIRHTNEFHIGFIPGVKHRH